MNRKFIYPFVIILVTITLYYAEDLFDTKAHSSNGSQVTTVAGSVEFANSMLPSSGNGDIVMHDFFTLSYSEKDEQAAWVAYELKRKHLSGNKFDRPYFEADKRVKTHSADWRDYKNSGFDRGHLCPAGDRRFSFEAYNETFLTSNISPQNRDFNRGIWNRLEQKVRFWAEKYDGVYVVTAGVLKGNMKTIGSGQISVPNEFYKIVVDATDGNYKAIAFLIPNKPSPESFYRYVVSIDSIETITGIDFFPNLPDTVENEMESKIDLKAWVKK